MINQRVLEDYIDAESNDSALYRELARHADNVNSAKLLKEIADDEERHAASFTKLYESYFKSKHEPQLKTVKIIHEDFPDIIADRILDESDDSRKYDIEMHNQPSMPIQNILHRASVDENVHAHRLTEILFEYILNKDKMS